MEESKETQKKNIADAFALLPEEARSAINAVDWRAVVLSMREKRKYTYDQLESLETITEMLLCGLVKPEEYNRLIGIKMRLAQSEASSLAKELNDMIFKKIRVELVKRIDQNKELTPKDTGYDPIKAQITEQENNVLKNAGVQIEKEKTKVNFTPKSDIKMEGEKELLNKIENTDLIQNEKRIIPTPVSEKKLTTPFQMKTVTTNHSPVITPQTEKPAMAPSAVRAPLPNIDPYRENVE